MSIYSLGVRTTNSTIAQACVEIYTPSTLAIRVMEIGICNVAATGWAVGLGRPAAQGITPVAAAFNPEQSTADPAAKTNVSLSWGTSPTAPTTYLRRAYFPATIGAGVVWTFPRGLYLPADASLVLFNITAGPTGCDVWIVIDE
jgi:hypothetical protein